ncbi:MAG: CdiA family toxin C-terminal domain-containing protein [Elusimicrobiota bacterium]|nr:MAG: CdiA family toxin C-terminal domain-containing protein [Elusimicrobiota bacterium]
MRRRDGIKGAHEEALFRKALAEAHGVVTLEKPVPGFPGMKYVQYRLYQGRHTGGFTNELQAGVFEKTVVDGAIWSESHLAELGGRLFGKVGRDGQHRAQFEGVTFIGWIRNGELTSFGVDSWAGQPPLYAPSDVPAARVPVPKKAP